MPSQSSIRIVGAACADKSPIYPAVRNVHGYVSSILRAKDANFCRVTSGIRNVGFIDAFQRGTASGRFKARYTLEKGLHQLALGKLGDYDRKSK